MRIRNGVLKKLVNKDFFIGNLSMVEGEQKKLDGDLTKCAECDEINFDWCWNCEKPVCKKHGYVIAIPKHNIKNSLCVECKEALTKLGNTYNKRGGFHCEFQKLKK